MSKPAISPARQRLKSAIDARDQFLDALRAAIQADKRGEALHSDAVAHLAKIADDIAAAQAAAIERGAAVDLSVQLAAKQSAEQAVARLADAGAVLHRKLAETTGAAAQANKNARVAVAGVLSEEADAIAAELTEARVRAFTLQMQLAALADTQIDPNGPTAHFRMSVTAQNALHLTEAGMWADVIPGATGPAARIAMAWVEHLHVLQSDATAPLDLPEIWARQPAARAA